MIDPNDSTTMDAPQIKSSRLANLLLWFVTRYNDRAPGPCPDPGRTEDEVAIELIEAGLLEIGPLGEETIPTPEGWRLVGDVLARRAEGKAVRY